MKRSLPVWIVFGVLVAGGGIFLLTQQLSGSFLTSRSDGQTDAPCEQVGTTHVVNISNNKVKPLHTKATQCDKLVIINNDNKVRDIAFGVHDKHIVYDGVSVKTLSKNQRLEVTLNKTGTYLFHDHHQEEVAGDFTVK